MADVFEKVELPSGAWAALRDPSMVTGSQRRPLERAQMRMGLDKQLQTAIAGEDDDERNEAIAALSDAQLDRLGSFMDSVAVTLLESWSFKKPIDVESLRGLPAADMDKIVTAAMAHRDALMPNFEVTPDPDSPTEPSGD